MLIIMEPPEQPVKKAATPTVWRKEYLALAAVLFAIAVSLLGLAVVFLEAAAEPQPQQIGRLTVA